ncbi:MAG: hypothetical protein KAI47_27800 [Deltaproteobacteria bacterium]|nr:hypothetical protein [Deltaproteobacteria bacterium]
MIADFNRFRIAPALLAALALTGCASDLGGSCHNDKDCAGALRCLQRPQSDRGICVYPESLRDLGSDHEPSHDLRGPDASEPLEDLLRDQTLDVDALPIPQDLSRERGEGPQDLAPQDTPFTEIVASDAGPDARADTATDLSPDAHPPHDAPQDHAGNPSDGKLDVPPPDTATAANDI